MNIFPPTITKKRHKNNAYVNLFYLPFFSVEESLSCQVMLRSSHVQKYKNMKKYEICWIKLRNVTKASVKEYQI